MIIGINATNSLSSDVSRFFTGSPTDKAVWMLIGGSVAAIAGLTMTLRGGKQSGSHLLHLDPLVDVAGSSGKEFADLRQGGDAIADASASIGSLPGAHQASRRKSRIAQSPLVVRWAFARRGSRCSKLY